MDRVLPPSSRRSIDRGTTSPVRDVWSRELQKRTSDTAHRRSAELAASWILAIIAITHGNLEGLMNLTRYPEQMRENVRRFDVKQPTDSWTKKRDLRHTPIQYILQQNRFGTGEDETIQKEQDVRRHAGGMPLLTDLSLAMRTDPLALIRGATEFVTVIHNPRVGMLDGRSLWTLNTS